MKLTFQDSKAIVAHVNARAEQHGEEQEPAADIKLILNLPSERMNDFHPELKGMLYFKDTAREGEDLADKGTDAPHFRFQKLALPLKWTDEMVGATLKIHRSGKPLTLKDVKVNNFSIKPMEGGTLELTLRVQAHPNEEQFGKLSTMIKNEVRISLEPAEDGGVG